jgi:micrococcal nuclease
MRQLVLLALACSLPCAAAAAQFTATVSYITDGDTVWVRPLGDGPPQQVRIDGIDAPEICQPFGAQSRDALAARVLRHRVVVITRGEDDYRRTIGRLRMGREDVGAWMVSHGYAWSYRFRGHPGPYVRQERRARDAQLGLWSGGAVESPREFRVRHGSCH